MKNNINIRTKKDIQITRERGHSIVRLKNGQYFKVDKLTSDLLNLLKDSNWTVNSLITKLQKMGHKVSEDGWRRIILKLKGNGFFIGEAEKIKSEYWVSFRILSGKALSAITSVFSFLFNPFVGGFLLCFIAVSAFFFFEFFPKNISSTQDFIAMIRQASKVDLIIFFLLIFFVSFIHELGHASALRYFGKKASKIGIGMYVCIPTIYTDVTESWGLNRKSRIIVNFGGVYFQLFFTSIFILLQFLLNSSANTSIFLLTCTFIFISALVNLVPYFHRDGYWIASDILDLPNLNTKKKFFLKTLIKAAFNRNNKTPQLDFLKNFTLTKKFLFYAYSIIYALLIPPAFIGVWILGKKLFFEIHSKNLFATKLIIIFIVLTALFRVGSRLEISRNSIHILSLKYFLTFRDKSIFVILNAVIGTMVMFLSLCFLASFMNSWKSAVANEFSGDLFISSASQKQVYLDQPYSKILKPLTNVSQLNIVPNISSVSYRTRGVGYIFIEKTKNFLPVNFIGVEPSAQEGGSSVLTIKKGGYLSKNKANIIVHEKISQKLLSDVGDDIIIFARNVDGFFVPQLFQLQGVFSSPIRDRIGMHGVILMDKEGANKLLGFPKYSSQEAAINLTNKANLSATKRAIDNLNIANTYSPEKTIKFFRGFNTFFQLILGTMLGIIFIIYGISMYFTQWSKIMHRYREIGTMIAIGGKVKHILSILIFENLLGTCTSTATGITLSLVLAHYIRSSELLTHDAVTTIFISNPELLTPLWAIGTTVIFVLFINMLATLYPIYRAATVNPIKVIRNL